MTFEGAVRPTQGCLADLRLSFPSLTIPLQSMEHPLIAKSQELPAASVAGSLGPILSLKDRDWWKVKVMHFRGAATNISDLCEKEAYAPAAGEDALWWLSRAGVRQADSANDFYKSISQHAVRLVTEHDAKAGRKTDTTAWLPRQVDMKRLSAEKATRFVADIQATVVSLIARSMRDGQIWRAEAAEQEIVAQVRADDGEAYLALGAAGYYNEKIVAIVLDSVPGVSASDWMIEPSEVRGFEPAPGQVVFSTILSPAVQNEFMNIELPADWAESKVD
jgi:hypothetical protein